MHGYTLFDTALGRCAIAWGEDGIVALELPAAEDAATRRRILRAHARTRGSPRRRPTSPRRSSASRPCSRARPTTSPASGSTSPACPRSTAASTRPPAPSRPGSTRSYGEVAALVGEPGSAQAVGQALGRNPVPIVVPCHRVLAADGSLHGFSAPGGLDTKRRMLEIEGAAAPALF